MSQVVLYTTRFCPYCIRAKMLLHDNDIQFKDIPVDRNPSLRQEMIRKSGRHTVPQIFINDKPIGGFDELSALDRQGKLDHLFNQ